MQMVQDQQKPGFLSQLAMAYVGGNIGNALAGEKMMGISDYFKKNLGNTIAANAMGQQNIPTTQPAKNTTTPNQGINPTWNQSFMQQNIGPYQYNPDQPSFLQHFNRWGVR